jgi:hypothetical protein
MSGRTTHTVQWSHFKCDTCTSRSRHGNNMYSTIHVQHGISLLMCIYKINNVFPQFSPSN